MEKIVELLRKRAEDRSKGAFILLPCSLRPGAGGEPVEGFILPLPPPEMVTAYAHYFHERTKDLTSPSRGLPPGMSAEDVYLRMVEETDLERERFLVVTEGKIEAGERVSVLVNPSSSAPATFNAVATSPEDEGEEWFLQSACRFVSLLTGKDALSGALIRPA
ncbi:MAG: hypothetical protein D6713_10475 [Deltaproteobacteria bacterium]|nr:MAG: hypothetical protein D6713_10475 [Deltaproteobacteria bacterium]